MTKEKMMEIWESKGLYEVLCVCGQSGGVTLKLTESGLTGRGSAPEVNHVTSSVILINCKDITTSQVE